VHSDRCSACYSGQADISRWSAGHRLKLNPDKSEVIWLGTQEQLAKLSLADKTLQLHDCTLRACITVCNLGVENDRFKIYHRCPMTDVAMAISTDADTDADVAYLDHLLTS